MLLLDLRVLDDDCPVLAFFFRTDARNGLAVLAAARAPLESDPFCHFFYLFFSSGNFS